MGLGKVLSATVRIPCFLPRAATAARSVRARVGFEGVSTQIIAVSGRSAASHSARSRVFCTQVTCRPRSASQRRMSCSVPR